LRQISGGSQVMSATILRQLPPDPEKMNAERARWAGDVLEFFEIFGERPHREATEEERRVLMEQNLSDLIADFAHFCDRTGLEMRTVLRTAIRHYQEETNGEGDQFSPRITLVKQ
jgi:hypothetical protein